MATKTEEGTGKHPHKSAADPTEHHEATTGKTKSSGSTESHTAADSKSTKSEASSTSDGQGTGKHKHKSAAEPYEHHGKD